MPPPSPTRKFSTRGGGVSPAVLQRRSDDLLTGRALTGSGRATSSTSNPDLLTQDCASSRGSCGYEINKGGYYKVESSRTSVLPEPPLAASEDSGSFSESTANTPDESSGSGTPEEDGGGANIANTVYNHIPIPFFDLFGIGQFAAKAADTYVLNPIVAKVVDGIDKKLPAWKEATKSKREGRKSRSSKKGKRTRSLERRVNDTEMQRDILVQNTVEVEPDHEPEISEPEPCQMLYTPRGELVKPYPQIMVQQEAKARVAAIEDEHADLVVRERNVSLGKDKMNEREFFKKQLTGEEEGYQPVCMSGSSWDFPLMKRDMTDRLTLRLGLETDELRDTVVRMRTRELIRDWRGGNANASSNWREGAPRALGGMQAMPRALPQCIPEHEDEDSY